VASYACTPIGNPMFCATCLACFLTRKARSRSGPPACGVAPVADAFRLAIMPANARRNGRALAPLLKDAITAWRDLAEQAAVSDLFRHEAASMSIATGCHAERRLGRPAAQELGVRQEWLTSAQVIELEPALPLRPADYFFRTPRISSIRRS